MSTCGTPAPAVVFHSVGKKKSPTVSLCQTLCMNSILQKTEKENPGGCKCTILHLPACAFDNNEIKIRIYCYVGYCLKLEAIVGSLTWVRLIRHWAVVHESLLEIFIKRSMASALKIVLTGSASNRLLRKIYA